MDVLKQKDTRPLKLRKKQDDDSRFVILDYKSWLGVSALTGFATGAVSVTCEIFSMISFCHKCAYVTMTGTGDLTPFSNDDFKYHKLRQIPDFNNFIAEITIPVIIVKE
jgi:hypothetical protein